MRSVVRSEIGDTRSRSGLCREGGSKTKKIEFLNSMSERRSTGRSTSMHREEKPWVVDRHNS